MRRPALSPPCTRCARGRALAGTRGSPARPGLGRPRSHTPCRACRYASEHLKFGLLDVSVFRRLAAQLAIDTSTVARQLPVLMLFEKGKEADRVGYRKQGLLMPSDSFRREVGPAPCAGTAGRRRWRTAAWWRRRAQVRGRPGRSLTRARLLAPPQSDIVKKFSLEQRSKGEPVGGEPKKKR